MADRTIIGLDDPAFHGRLRRIQARESLIQGEPRPFIRPSANYFSNNLSDIRPNPRPIQTVETFDASPVEQLNQPPVATSTMVLELPEYIPKKVSNWNQTALIAISLIFFMVGLYVSGITLKTNADVKARLQSQHQSR